MSIKISPISNTDVPFDLLYLADEDENQINKYRSAATFFAAYENEEIQGMIGLLELNPKQAEIVCVAVYEKFQNRGIGTRLLEEAIGSAKKKAFSEVIIKTGDCGIRQLSLYQRCGFRMESINRDYFLKYYPVPIYEDGLQCRNQVVLNYRIYSKAEQDEMVTAYHARFLKQHPEYSGRPYEVWGFCYGEMLPDKLLGLVKTGKKTGTSSALDLYGENEKVPEEGDLSVITYGNGLPGCIIETKEIRVKKFCEITAEEARLEGEGDLSLAYWKQAHEWFFRMEYKDAGREFSENIPVIFERFEVICNRDAGV